MVVKKVVQEAVYEDLMTELIATVKVPSDLPIAPGIVLKCPTKQEVEDLGKAADEEAAQRIIFGENYDAASELFNGQPLHIWNKFMERYNEHFFGTSDAGK